VNLLLQSFRSVSPDLHHIISTDEDPGLRIESFAVINLRGVSTNKKYYMFYCHANIQRTYCSRYINIYCYVYCIGIYFLKYDI
jgi:hypothetical protein